MSSAPQNSAQLSLKLRFAALMDVFRARSALEQPVRLEARTAIEEDSTSTPSPVAAPKEAQNRPPERNGKRRLPPWLRRFSSLRWRMAFIYVALFALFAFLISVLLYNAVSTILYTDGQAALLQNTAHLRMLLTNEVDCNNLPLASAFKDVRLNAGSNDIDAIYATDMQGRVIASSDDTLMNRQLPYISPAVFSTSQNVVTAEVFHLQHTQNGPVDAALISLGSSPTGCANRTAAHYLVVTTSYTVEQSTLTRLLLLIGLVAGILTLLGAVIVFVITSFVLRPLVYMRDAALAIAMGDLGQRGRLPHTDDEIGQLSTSIGQMIDQMEQARASYRSAEQKARRFFSDASHQLRTPLTSIYGFTQLLLRGAKDDPVTLNRVLRMMKNESERMSRLVNDLLTLSRLDDGRALRTGYVDMVEIAIEAVEQAKLMATDGRTISLYLATEERLGVRADVDLLKQALVALFDNALRYGKQGPEGWIKLVLDRQNGQVIVRIIDNGNGIRAEDLPHVFDRFYRGKNLPTLEGQAAPVAGTGLGLSIALAIVQAHHGTITASSSSTEEGTSETAFTIILPAAD